MILGIIIGLAIAHTITMFTMQITHDENITLMVGAGPFWCAIAKIVNYFYRKFHF